MHPTFSHQGMGLLWVTPVMLLRAGKKGREWRLEKGAGLEWQVEEFRLESFLAGSTKSMLGSE